MRLSLNQLYIFYLAVKHDSLKKAAAALYVSPPAVTMQIKKLEDWLGFPVFERVQGRRRLTERGRGLYAALEPMFSKTEDLDQYIRDLKQDETHQLKLGTHHLPARYFIPDLLAHITAKFPRLRVELELDVQDKLLEKLAEQQLDIALVIGLPPRDSACAATHLFDVEMPLVVSATGALGGVSRLSVKDLEGMPLIVQQKGAGARTAVLSFLQRHRIAPAILRDNLSSDVIIQFLHAMNAAAFIGRFIVGKELDSGRLHEIRVDEGLPVSRFYLTYAAAARLPMKIRHFLSGIEGFTPRIKTTCAAGSAGH